MEVSELSYVTSTEEQRTHSSSQPKTTTSVTLEKPTYVRFLVSNSAAGSVIGKGGSTITDFQSQSGARIQLSRNHEFFPGTTERIIMVSGAISDIMKGVELILSKLLNELQNEEGDDFETKTKVRLIVPNSSCGGIIGKGGATVKAFMEESRAGIKISPQDNDFGVNDRLVTLTGSIDEQLHAIDLIVSKLADDPHYSQAMSSPLSYPGVGFSSVHGIPHTYVLPSVATSAYNAMTYLPNRTGGKFHNKEERSNSLTIGVADDHIGIIVGRGGRNIMDISQISGARIKISDRGDFMSGTNDRKVTITGSLRAIRTAETMILQKVAYASEKTND